MSELLYRECSDLFLFKIQYIKTCYLAYRFYSNALCKHCLCSFYFPNLSSFLLPHLYSFFSSFFSSFPLPNFLIPEEPISCPCLIYFILIRAYGFQCLKCSAYTCISFVGFRSFPIHMVYSLPRKNPFLVPGFYECMHLERE